MPVSWTSHGLACWEPSRSQTRLSPPASPNDACSSASSAACGEHASSCTCSWTASSRPKKKMAATRNSAQIGVRTLPATSSSSSRPKGSLPHSSLSLSCSQPQASQRSDRWITQALHSGSWVSAARPSLIDSSLPGAATPLTPVRPAAPASGNILATLTTSANGSCGAHMPS